MANWIAREFDWTLGRYTGNYYNIAQAGVVAVFVDSHFGLDTNAGTAIAPFRTLTRAINHLNTNGANGSRIFMNGVFSENLPTQTFWYEFIGCGGGKNGRTLWANTLATSVRPLFIPNSSRYYNIETLNYNNLSFHSDMLGQCFMVNCYLKNTISPHLGSVSTFTVFFSIWVDITTTIFRFTFTGSNNILINFIGERTTSTVTNTYSLNSGAPTGAGNIHNVAAHFINASLGDFNVRITSPLLQAGTLDEITGIRANVGGVQVGLPYNGLNAEFTTAGGAVITNLTVDANGRYTLTPPNRTGTLVSGVMDLGNIYPIENIDLFNVFDFLSGQITQGVFETFVSPKMSLTIRIRYGNTVAELDACPWLLIEYGKLPTFSGTGASRVGNAAPTFTAANFQTITCRFLRISLTLQNNS